MLTLLGVIVSAVIFILLGRYTNKNQRSKLMAYVTAIMLTFSAIFVFFAVQNNFDEVYDYLPYVTQFAFGFFVTLMFAKPIHLILKNKTTMHLLQARRELGITTWLLFVPHAMLNAINFLGQGNFDLPILGGVAVITLMTIVVFTSFNWTKSFVTNKWFKIIQNLAYIAFFLALVHGFIMSADFVYLGIAFTYLITRIFTYVWYENKKRKWIYASIFTVAALLSISSALAVSVDNADMVPEPYFDDSDVESNSSDDNSGSSDDSSNDNGSDDNPDTNDDNGGSSGGNGSDDSPDTYDDNGGANGGNGYDDSPDTYDDNGGANGGNGYDDSPDTYDDNGGANGGNGSDDSPDTYDDNGGSSGGNGSDDSPDTYDDNGGSSGGHGSDD